MTSSASRIFCGTWVGSKLKTKSIAGIRQPARLLISCSAGPGLWLSKRWIVQPHSEFSMSLVGFDHVFSGCIGVELSPGISCKVAPLPVIAFLKIAAYLEDKHRRAKDLDDLKLLLRSYATGTDRIFSEDVFNARLEDMDLANAYLLGLDIKAFAGPEELQLVETFVDYFIAGAESDHLDDRHGIHFRKQLQAFRRALAID